MDWPSTLLKFCPKFKAMNPVQRGKKMEEIKGCSRCTSWKHQNVGKSCPRSKSSCSVQESGVKCGKDHDTSLHGSGSQYCSSAGVRSTVATELSSDNGADMCAPVLLEIQKVKLEVQGIPHEAVIFFDNGSTATLCTHRWAKAVGLQGKDVVYYLRVVGDQYMEKRTDM